MATRISTTRRALLAGSAAVPLAAVLPDFAAAQDDAAIVALWAKHGDIMRRWAPLTAAAGEAELAKRSDAAALRAAADEVFREGYPVERQILGTPAQSLMGVAIKLALWRYIDGDFLGTGRDMEWCAAMGALHDAERLLGRISTHWLCGDSHEFVENRETMEAAVADMAAGWGAQA